MGELELDDRRGRGDGFVGSEIPYEGGGLSCWLSCPTRGASTRFASGSTKRCSTRSMPPSPPALSSCASRAKRHDDGPVVLAAGAGCRPGPLPGHWRRRVPRRRRPRTDITVDEWGTVAAAATAFDESSRPNRSSPIWLIGLSSTSSVTARRGSSSSPIRSPTRRNRASRSELRLPSEPYTASAHELARRSTPPPSVGARGRRSGWRHAGGQAATRRVAEERCPRKQARGRPPADPAPLGEATLPLR
jgi:hypothetical protein